MGTLRLEVFTPQRRVFCAAVASVIARALKAISAFSPGMPRCWPF